MEHVGVKQVATVRVLVSRVSNLVPAKLEVTVVRADRQEVAVHVLVLNPSLSNPAPVRVEVVHAKGVVHVRARLGDVVARVEEHAHVQP